MKQNYLKSLFLMLMLCIGMGAWAEEATMAAGTNGSAAKVNDKDAIKVGTSSKGGDMTITVPAGAISLEFYAAAWNGVSGLYLNITPTASVKETTTGTLKADTGISGNSPFTLEGNEEDYKITVELKDITKETTLKFASSATKRFVVWGATYTTGESTPDTPDPINYNVTITDGITGGTISANPTSAAEGATVTLTATPDAEYAFGSWNVTNASTSEAIEVTDNKFIMPAANVNVSATFNEVQTFEGIITTMSAGNDTDIKFVTGSSSETGAVWANSTPLTTNNITLSGSVTSGTNYSYYDGSVVRFYTNNNIVITPSNGATIVKVEIVRQTTTGNNSGTINCSGLTASSENTTTNTNIYTGSATSAVTFTVSAQARLTKIIVYSIGGDTPSDKTLTSIAVSGTPEALWTGDDFTHNGVTVTATYSDNTTDDVTASATFSGCDMTTSGQQSVTVTYEGQSTTYNVEVKTIANTQETAYTVAEAIALIDAGKGLNTEVYVKGTISEIVTAWSEQYGNVSFNISEDGTTEGTQFQFYRNFKSAEKTKWTAEDEKPMVGASVVGYGKLSKHNTTYEFAEGNYLVEMTLPQADMYTITIASIENGSVTADNVSAVEGATVTLTATPAEGYIFSEWNVTAGTVAITVENNKFTMPAANVTVSATFTEKPKTEAAIYLKKDIKDILSTDVVIITMTNANGTYAISNDNGTSAAPTAVQVDVNDDKIESSDANILWNITYTDDNLAIYPNAITSSWLYCTNTNNGVRVGTNDNNLFVIDGTYLKHSGTSRYVGVYNNQDFRCYTSKGGNIENQTLAFYVKTSGNVTPDPEPTTNGTLAFKATNEDGYWATFSCDKDVIFDANDVIVYTVAVDDNQIVMIEANDNSLSCVTDKTKDEGWVAGYYVQAGAAVLINSVDESVNYYFIDTDPFISNDLNEVETDPEYNMLVPCTSDGIFKAEADGNMYYKLAYGDYTNKTKLGFWWGADDGSANFKVKAGGAVLCVPQATATSVKGFSFDMANDQDAIQTLEQKSFDTVIYDMQGRKVSKTQKGLYIVNGRKMVK